ncbi:cytochrome c oxidase accessory protein CcoG [Hyphococcus luteus]|uniref:Cytochrome c oxidase accessory protein CcoG n=1 Tax=Hyphococcus luteus TaxID=2058213 RepID=A0A2S7K8Q5_9PROT|nr:cytochrome c oxidase accessory protein CcoG [Marinicaulis flavus]PQA88880.1 cytochrome c oxidase accessory protein CcoG [Marinicaulis flavus]
MSTTTIEKPAKAASGVEQHDVAAVNSAAGRTLYKKREPIYPKLVHGKFRALKWFVLCATLGVYYLLPWVRWPRGPGEPDQAVLVDFAGRRFYFFFIEIWPDELYFLTGLLILAALGLFLATALFGRIWCGYACPQTVWTDLYIAVERMIEGDRNKRMRLDKAPWSAEKIGKKVSKHALWLVIAALTGGAWIFYFHDAPTVLPEIFRGEAPPSAYLFIGVLTFTTYMLAGSMREQVCTYMCPWPRIQAALTDNETLEVTYKYDRGEPRGAHKKNESWEGRGDCIDCKACVAACPMGIDIREGAQLECINCALCIDACDDIMKKVGRPTGLIGYDTDKNIERRVAGKKPSISLVRARTILYAALIVVVGGMIAFGLSSRATLEVNVLRDRTPPYVMLSDGSVRNAYTVKLVNKNTLARDFRITVDGPEGLEVSAVGEEAAGNSVTVTAEGDAVRSVRLFVTLSPSELMGAEEQLMITVEDVEGGETAKNPTGFMTGAR